MRCLGPAILNFVQQRNLEDGRPVLVVRDAVFPDAAEKAVVGDIFWVKEPFIIIQSHRFTGPKNIHRHVPGSPLGKTIPKELRDWWHVFRRFNGDAKNLARNESRAVLVIGAISDKGFHCVGHMKHIDEFLGNKKADAA